MKTIANIFTGILCAVSIAFVVWFCVSVADIVADNTSGNPTTHEYNLFANTIERVQTEYTK